MKVRAAQRSDAEELSRVLEALVVAGKRKKSGDADFVRSHYIDHSHKIRCSVAVGDEGEILGFQSLKRAHAGNPYGTPAGWGIIGTHVRPSAARRGVGSRLFSVTLAAARRAGLPEIEAYIGEGNLEAIAYYEGMGFTTYRFAEGVVCKSFKVS